MKRRHIARQLSVADRIQKLTKEVEELLPDLKAALAQDDMLRTLLTPATKSLERAAIAVRTLAEQSRQQKAGSEFTALLEGASPLMSLLGSRVVLSGKPGKARTPSAGAQVLAMLMEHPGREFEAAEIADRLGVSIPAARTTLNRLVQSGHAMRPSAGRFKAR